MQVAKGRHLATRGVALLAILLVGCIAAGTAQALPSRVWTTTAGSSGYDATRSMTPLPDGTSLAAGHFTGTATFGAITAVSAGSDDAFVAKLNFDGTYNWVVRIGGTGSDRAFEAVPLADGSAIIVGFFQGSVVFGSQTLTSAGGYDTFAAKLNPDRTWAWATRAGGLGDDYFYRLAVRPNGKMVVAGSYQLTATFGTTTLPTSAGGGDLFMAELNADGTYAWARRVGSGPTFDDIFGLVLNTDGTMMVTGYFRESLVIGGTTFTSAGSADILIAKLDATGNVLWARRMGGPSEDFGYSISVVGDGSATVTGYFQGTGDFLGTNLTSAGDKDGFIVRVDSSGTLQWARRFGSTGIDMGRWVSVRADGTVLLTGSFEGTTTLGSTSLASAGAADILVAELDATGSFVWASRVGGTGNETARWVGLRPDGALMMAGSYTGTVSLGGSSITSTGGDDMITEVYAYPLGAPTTLSATASDGQAVVTWNPATTRGGETITGYVATAIEDPTRSCTWTSGPLTCTVTGLTNGQTYTFIVTASSSAGVSAASLATNAVTPSAPSSGGGSGSGSGAAPSEETAAPVAVAPAMATAAPVVRLGRLTRSIRCIGRTCITTGATPAGDVRIVQTATRLVLDRRGAGGGRILRTARAECVLTEAGRTIVHRYHCSLRLVPGTWRVVTRAYDGAELLEQLASRVTIRGAARPEAITG